MIFGYSSDRAVIELVPLPRILSIRGIMPTSQATIVIADGIELILSLLMTVYSHGKAGRDMDFSFLHFRNVRGHGSGIEDEVLDIQSAWEENF